MTPGSSIDSRWSRILYESNIDGIEDSDLVDDAERRKYTDPDGPAAAQLIRVVVDLDPKPVVQTCRGLPQDDPWHLSYLAVLGDLSPCPHPQNSWNDLRRDLTLDEILTIHGVEGNGSAAGLLALLQDFTTTSAVDLSRAKLTTGLQGSYNQSFPASSRFQWDDDRVAQQFGPNLVVVYEPASVDDLALIWNLRARFLHPRRLPLALPMSDSAGDDLRRLLDSGAEHHFGFGHSLALTSFSVPSADLESLAAVRGLTVVDPWQLLRPIGGYCVISTETARFTRGRATIAAFSPTDLQTIGASYLGRHYGTWLKRKAVLIDEPVPLSPTMRHGEWHGDAYYLQGHITTGGEPGGYSTIRVPAGREVMVALGADRGLELIESAPERLPNSSFELRGHNFRCSPRRVSPSRSASLRAAGASA